MLKNWTFLYSVTKNLQKFKSNHNPSIELLKSVINSFTSQTVLWNFCVCVCVCVFSCQWVHTEGHRWLNLHWAEETICQDPLPWLTSLHIRAEKSGRRGGKEDGSDREWKWEKVKREDKPGERFRRGRGEGRGRTRCWCPGDSERVVSHSHLSLRVPHPDPFPGHIPQLTAREKSMSTTEAASRLWSSQKQPSLSGENTFIKALVERLNEQLSERCHQRPFTRLFAYFSQIGGPVLIWMDPP